MVQPDHPSSPASRPGTGDNHGPRPANARGAARLAAVQALYQMDVGGADAAGVVAEFEAFRLGKEVDGATYRAADHAWFRDVVGGVVTQQRTIDARVHAALAAANWPLGRIDATLRAILRCGAYELFARRDVPARVILSEYIDVAKAFYAEDEPRLVNGVLDHVAHALRPEEFAAGAGT